MAPIDVFLGMGLLDDESIRAWRRGQTPYLEKVIRCNLKVASRILRILRIPTLATSRLYKIYAV